MTAADGDLGSLGLNADGSYTYTVANSTVEYLAAGESKIDTFTVTSLDGTTRDLSFTIYGINEAPVFSGDAAGAAYAANGAAVGIVTNVLASDIDSANYNGGTLKATVLAGGHEGDTLSIASDFISVDVNSEIFFDADGTGTGAAVDIGTLTDNGINSLMITLNSGADDAAVAALTKAIQFSNSTSDPFAGPRTVAFTLHDGGGTDNGGQDSAYFTAEVDVTAAVLNHAPVISTDQFQVTENQEDGTTTISGLYVSDADSSDTFTLTATTGDTPVTTVTPSSGGPEATLTDINETLGSVTYDPGPIEFQPQTDSVTFTVTDSFGATDTVNFIFNQGGTGPNVTLTGTSGKDVLFGTDNQDQFVFAANSNHDTIMNFTSVTDHIDLSAIASTNAPDWFANHVTTTGADSLVTIDAADTILVRGAHLAANDFILHLGGGN